MSSCTPSEIINEDDVALKVVLRSAALNDCITQQGPHYDYGNNTNNNIDDDNVIFPIAPGLDHIGAMPKYGIEVACENKHYIGNKVIALINCNNSHA